MTHTTHLTRRALAALVAAGLAIPATTTAGRAGEPLQCEIHVSRQAGRVALEAVVTTHATTSGSYELRVSGTGDSGASDISQSGDFSLATGETRAIGEVTLAGDSGTYVARLAVTTATAVHRCTRRIAGSI